ncbi:MAG: restriction endonuclease subunit S [Deltaproteobacteria bacterium]|nr:restriction endonuclease subunit S [Deltaproteobacteria bacterium]
MSNKAEDGAMKSVEKRGSVPKLRFPEFWEAGEWVPKKLIEVLNPATREVAKPSSSYLALGIRSHGKGTFHKPNQAPEKNSMNRLYLVYRDDLVVNITFAWEGAIAIAGDDDHCSYVSHRFPAYTFKSLASMPAFFRHVITSKAFVYKLGLISPGGAGRNRVMNKKDFLKIPVLFPSLPEQQKIADCLASLDELITLEAQKLGTLKTHKKGLMQQLFPAEGETLPKLRFPEFREAGEWEPKSIGQLGEVVTGSTPSTAQPEFYGGERLFVSPADISDDRFIKKTKTTLTEPGFRETRPIKANSILFVCIGSTIGKIAQNRHECATNQQINSVIPNSENSDGFVYYALSGIADKIANLAGKQAVPIVNKSLFSSIELTVPKLPEQDRIAICLSSLDELILAQTQKLVALKTHKKGLMQQLFPSLDESPA